MLNFKTNKDIYFALIAYSLLNKTIKKVNQEYLDDYNMEIINLLLSLKNNQELANKYDKLIFIVNNKIIYENLEYIEKICLLNTSNYNLERITEINNYLNKKEIFFKYLDLLIKNPLEKVTFNLKLKANNLLKLETRLIGIEAILNQSSYKGIENMILATLNDTIYKNQIIFNLIKEEKNHNKQRNLIEFASLDFLINKNDTIIKFSLMNESWQRECLNKLYEAKRRIIENENKNLNLDNDINEFYTTRSSLEKTKILRDNLKKLLK